MTLLLRSMTFIFFLLVLLAERVRGQVFAFTPTAARRLWPFYCCPAPGQPYERED